MKNSEKYRWERREGGTWDWQNKFHQFCAVFESSFQHDREKMLEAFNRKHLWGFFWWNVRRYRSVELGERSFLHISVRMLRKKLNTLWITEVFPSSLVQNNKSSLFSHTRLSLGLPPMYVSMKEGIKNAYLRWFCVLDEKNESPRKKYTS